VTHVESWDLWLPPAVPVAEIEDSHRALRARFSTNVRVRGRKALARARLPRVEALEWTRPPASLTEKFAYKGLPDPTVSAVVDRIDTDALRAGWQQQLRHQLPMLPPLDDFLAGLEDELTWWLEPTMAKPLPDAISTNPEESPVRRQMFPAAPPGLFGVPGFVHPTVNQLMLPSSSAANRNA